LRVLHPGGGSSYAISYTSQKIVESYTGAEKPDILFDGHYHKAGYNYIRGVHVVQTGCTQDQTPFMRKKRLAAHLGGWIIEFTVDTNGAVIRFKQEWIPFFDKAYYKKWEYLWK
jgi:predicted phosphodiesterase